MPSQSLPTVPAKHPEFLEHVAAHPHTPMVELLEPYKQYDAVLREIFAQEPDHSAVKDNLANILPLYKDGSSTEIKIRARNLETESEDEKQKYVMPLADGSRKPNGSPAVVSTFKEFQTNFNIFSESSLSEMDWSNVVVAGSSVVTSLLPVPEQYSSSKRGLRQYYHEILAPASDIDLFLYGLSEEQAVEKIEQIERSIKDSILYETTTIRTKNAITIASQYPTRHVQIVLRIYKSIAEILTGFDVDCSCAAYDGKQVYVAPRALASYITQVNHVDLSRRSPSYENRLSKYSHRGFEVFWPQLDRSRIDPTIFERSFARTVGLARLLVLEKLPKPSDRDAYMDQRRRERGRPAINRHSRISYKMRGNLKSEWDDEVAEWVEEDQVSDYHTFTIPYGEKFHAKRIEKLLYSKDLLLNAEWNKPKDREVNLHRHPAFFGDARDVMHDCCGYCPQPSTPEEEKVAEEEGKTYVSGSISFIKDNPGRQAIGSFNPITETDWTEMAYVGNTARLCQAIVDQDLEHVKDWLAQDDSDPNRRDYTGRTPLHLACMTSTPEIVQCLVDHGARLIWRLADGRTALHLAAARGSVEIVKILLTKSEENEEEEAKRESQRKEAKLKSKDGEEAPEQGKSCLHGEANDDLAGESEDDGEMIDDVSDADGDDMSIATGSFVKVKENEEAGDNVPDDKDDDDEPDVYDINVLAWDTHASPLHLAILNGHVDVVEELVGSFGADVLLPIKLLNEYNKTPRAAILTLVLALNLPVEKATAMTAKLLELGASTAQADMDQTTALHYFVAAKQTEPLDVLFSKDEPAVKRAINHLAITGNSWRPSARSALMTAINAKNTLAALKLLEGGAKPSIEFEDFYKSVQMKYSDTSFRSTEDNENNFQQNVEQPLVQAVDMDLPDLVLELLNHGADPNTLQASAHMVIKNVHQRTYHKGKSILDAVQDKIAKLKEYNGEKPEPVAPLEVNSNDGYYLKGLAEDSYQLHVATMQLKDARETYDREKESFDRLVKEKKERKGLEEKKRAIRDLIEGFKEVESQLLSKKAKTFSELYPDIEGPADNNTRSYGNHQQVKEPFKVEFNFGVPDLTDIKREGYMKLFNAAWTGDLATIKSLTLSLWGPENDRTPLQIATKDRQSFSPFHIAVLRGHLEVAKAIVEIANAQYQPNEEKKQQYFDGDYDNSECDSCDDDESDDGNSIRLYSEIIDDQFTIDNIGEVATQVKSRHKPITVVQWTAPADSFLEDMDTCNALQTESTRKDQTPAMFVSYVDPNEKHFPSRRPNRLVQYAIWKDDTKLLEFLLDLGEQYAALDKDEDSSSAFTVPEQDVLFALRHGRTKALAVLIKRTAAGIPLDELVKKSGVEVKEKPRYYQGLSIHGKKRTDWAEAGRGRYMASSFSKDKHPPLLEAASQGSLESVEWFLSTAPMRHYSEFAGTHAHDVRLKRLAQAEGGIHKSISSWLDTRSHLVLHCAVMAQPTEESARVVEYLIKTVPSSLEARSAFGHTALSLAFSLHRVRFARILIEAGADQTVRDHKGNNLLHLALCGLDNRPRTSDVNLRHLFDLVDPRLVPSMLTERSSDEPGSLTPLARWLRRTMAQGENWNYQYNYSFDGVVKSLESEDEGLAILRAVLDLSARTTDTGKERGQEHLELLDGAGNTPVHEAIRFRMVKGLALMLNHRPDLLHRENATGQTAAELAEVQWVSNVTSDPPELPASSMNMRYWQREKDENKCIVERSPECFVAKEEESEGKSGEAKIWEFCKGRIEKRKADDGIEEEGSGNRRETKRRLVNLLEANEVARRLAARQNQSSRMVRFRGSHDDEKEKEEEKKSDEVSQWYKSVCIWEDE